jgi:hypothetical protein
MTSWEDVYGKKVIPKVFDYDPRDPESELHMQAVQYLVNQYNRVVTHERMIIQKFGRLGRNNPYRDLYYTERKGRPAPHRNVKPEHAAYFKVYVRVSTTQISRFSGFKKYRRLSSPPMRSDEKWILAID